MQDQSSSLHIFRFRRGDSPGFAVRLSYRVESAQGEPQAHFQLDGHVDNQPLQQQFSLRRDRALHFLHYASRCLRQHGVTPRHAALFRLHPVYDQMFEEVRAQMGCQLGQPVDLERVLKQD